MGRDRKSTPTKAGEIRKPLFPEPILLIEKPLLLKASYPYIHKAAMSISKLRSWSKEELTSLEGELGLVHTDLKNLTKMLEKEVVKLRKWQSDFSGSALAFSRDQWAEVSKQGRIKEVTADVKALSRCEEGIRASGEGLKRVKRGGMSQSAIAKKKKSIEQTLSKFRRQPQQHAFWKSVVKYVEPIRDEDLNLILPRVVEIDDSIWQIPGLGRHFSEVWQEEQSMDEMEYSRRKRTKTDKGYRSRTYDFEPSDSCGSDEFVGSDSEESRPPPKKVKEVPERRAVEMVKCGTLTARLAAALIEENIIIADSASYPKPNGAFTDSMLETAKSRGSRKVNVISEPVIGLDFSLVKDRSATTYQEMEERVRQELVGLGLLEDVESDKTAMEDDEVCAEIRRLQRLLREQIRVNNEEKTKLCNEVMKFRERTVDEVPNFDEENALLESYGKYLLEVALGDNLVKEEEES